MGGHRKQTASLKFPAKELGVLKKRSSNTELAVLLRNLNQNEDGK